MSELDEFLDDFLIESREGLDQFETDLVALEDAPGDAGLLDRMFRALHTIKGSAGFLELPNVRQLAHAGEDLLAKLRAGDQAMTPATADALLALGDALRSGMETVESTRGDLPSKPAELIGTLKQLAESGRVDGDSSDDVPRQPPDATVVDLDDASTAADDEPTDFAIAIDLDATFEKPQRDDEASVGDSVVIQLDENDADGPVAEETPDDGIDRPEPGKDASVAPQPPRPESLPQRESPPQRDGGNPASATIADSAPPPPEPPAGRRHGLPQATDSRMQPAIAGGSGIANQTIRVDIGLLDRLMNLVGELVLTRNQLTQIAQDLPVTHRDQPGDGQRLAEQRPSGQRVSEQRLGSVSQRLHQITTRLQDGVMQTRMQPIGGLFQRLPRVVRDAARQTGKSVAFVPDGEETELDKSLIEALADPLLHLVRNAVDHGIEPPAERERAGKSPAGEIRLTARHEAGQVVIEIADDGRGLDIERIRQKTIAKGIYDEREIESLPEAVLMESIFLPGFSTAAAVTSVSGRGVGMDVVKTDIERIGGNVVVRSVPGQGTTVRIIVPLTLAIISALIVTEGGTPYAIPQSYVAEVLDLFGASAPGTIESYHDEFVFRLRGELLPLVRLHDVLHPEPGDDRYGIVRRRVSGDDSLGVSHRAVILRVGDTRLAMLVESVSNMQEIVVKPLSAALERIRAYAGTTIMGDGGLALILDVLGIARERRLLGRELPRGETIIGDAAPLDTTAGHVVLCRVGRDRRIAIPAEVVDRIDIVKPGSIERDHVRPVLKAQDRIVPLVDAADYLASDGSSPEDAPLGSANDSLDVAAGVSKPRRIVLCHVRDRTVGLVVSKALEFVEHPADAAARTERGVQAGTVPPVNAGVEAKESAEAGHASLSRLFSHSAIILGRVCPVVDPEALLVEAGCGPSTDGLTTAAASTMTTANPT